MGGEFPLPGPYEIEGSRVTGFRQEVANGTHQSLPRFDLSDSGRDKCKENICCSYSAVFCRRLHSARSDSTTTTFNAAAEQRAGPSHTPIIHSDASHRNPNCSCAHA
jgi:hypothetical protein